ncbi:MAG: YigZ family protein [Micrococcaceae bacterium]
MNSYRTVENYRTLEFSLEVKRSEFIAYVHRVDSQEQAEEFIQSIRVLHPKARHVCWSFVLGCQQEIQRSSDDGEPSGTAGIPILQTIVKNSGELPLSDVVVVVVRYFGGTLLGTGGLARAYSEASAKALEQANFCSRIEQQMYAICVSFERVGKVENLLRQKAETPLEVKYLDDCVEIITPCCDTEFLKQLQLEYSNQGTRWIDMTL